MFTGTVMLYDFHTRVISEDKYDLFVLLCNGLIVYTALMGFF